MGVPARERRGKPHPNKQDQPTVIAVEGNGVQKYDGRANPKADPTDRAPLFVEGDARVIGRNVREP